jgi:hypothetical protein
MNNITESNQPNPEQQRNNPPASPSPAEKQVTEDTIAPEKQLFTTQPLNTQQAPNPTKITPPLTVPVAPPSQLTRPTVANPNTTTPVAPNNTGMTPVAVNNNPASPQNISQPPRSTPPINTQPPAPVQVQPISPPMPATTPTAQPTNIQQAPVAQTNAIQQPSQSAPVQQNVTPPAATLNPVAAVQQPNNTNNAQEAIQAPSRDLNINPAPAQEAVQRAPQAPSEPVKQQTMPTLPTPAVNSLMLPPQETAPAEENITPKPAVTQQAVVAPQENTIPSPTIKTSEIIFETEDGTPSTTNINETPKPASTENVKKENPNPDSDYQPFQPFTSKTNDKASLVAGYGDDSEDNDEIYHQTIDYDAVSSIEVGRESILPRLLKIITWVTIASIVTVGGWFLYPYAIAWFQTLNEEETPATVVPIASEVERAALELDDSIFKIEAFTGNTFTVPYTVAGTEQTVEIDVQLETIEKTSEFGALLEVAKTDLRNNAPSFLTPEQVEERISQYRFSFVKINMVYTGEPLEVTGQAPLRILPVAEGEDINISEVTGTIREHYIVNVSQNNKPAAIRYLIQNQECNLNDVIPDSFWQGNFPIQQCYVFLSASGFNTISVPHFSLEESVLLETPYKEN